MQQSCHAATESVDWRGEVSPKGFLRALIRFFLSRRATLDLIEHSFTHFRDERNGR